MIKIHENIEELSTFASGLAVHVGPIALEYFKAPLAVEQKEDLSPVTIADRTVEDELRRVIAQTYPEHGIYGEEHGRENLESEFIWVIDPIDGTKSFISGMPTFGTLIALLYQGSPIIGVIDMPALDERWMGISGKTTLRNNAQCKTSDCTSLNKATIYTTSPDMFDDAGWLSFDGVSKQAFMRRFGGDCYAYGLLASGHIDAVMEMSLEPYDFMALVPVVEQAGGTITDWQGNALTLQSDGKVVASASQSLHAEIISTINKSD